MFDITSYSPWLIVALVGLIIFRPDDWQELALNAGRWVRRVRAYVLEWQEYMEFTSDAGNEKDRFTSEIQIKKEQELIFGVTLWPSKEMGGSHISMPPSV
ncbi:MAG: hypothetical protein V4544_04445 [Pseudomonadota bacterium]